VDIEVAIIDRSALCRDRQVPRCYTAASKARHALRHFQSPLLKNVSVTAADSLTE
jgi:hypothetical protein